MNDRLRILFGCVLLGLIQTQPLEARPALTVQVPDKPVQINDEVFCRFFLEWPQTEGAYEFSFPEPRFKSLTLIHQGQSQETVFLPQGPASRFTVNLVLRATQKGEGTIFPFEIRFRKSSTEEWSTISVPPHQLKITSSWITKKMMPFVMIPILCSFFIFSIGFFLRGFLKKQRAKNHPAFPKDPKQELYQGAATRIAEDLSGDPQKCLSEWSLQLKKVVMAHYDLPSKALTEADILSLLKAKRLPLEEKEEIAQLFNRLTDIKFSQAKSDLATLQNLQKSLLQYVQGKIIIGNPST